MKRLVCLLLFVSITYAGCQAKKRGKVAVVATKRGWETNGDWKSNAVLRQEIVRLQDELNKARRMQTPEFLLTRLDDLEEVLLDKKYELVFAITSRRKEIDSAHAAIEAQRVTIEVLLKLCRLYEDSISTQRTTIEILKKMCRLYEDKADGL